MRKTLINKICVAFIASIFLNLAPNLLIASSLSNEEEITKKVLDFVEKVGNDVVATAKDKTNTEKVRKEKIVSIIDSAIDNQWISKFVLGKNFKSLTDEQKSKFIDLHHKFMVSSYGPKFSSFDGKSFKVLSVEKQTLFYLAKSEFLPSKSNQPVLIDFRVKENKGRLVIVDFIIEGVSLIETQRSEFNSAINAKGAENFFVEFESKVNSLQSK